MQEASQPGSSAPQPSALLRCISQLNTDTWAQVLLPKLVEQGSAAEVALSCSQLRDLCYSSRQSINLGALLDSTDPESLRSQVQNLPMHFPNCLTLSLEFKSDGCCHNLPYITPELARLPWLDGLSLDVTCKQHPLLSCFMLSTIRAQLPALRGLTLALKHPQGWLHAKDLHVELGRMTQLTRLCVSLPNMQVLSALTGLTRLEVNVYEVGTLADLSSCVNLQHLAVCMSFMQCSKQQRAHEDVQLNPADWSGLAALTCLTELRLLNVAVSEASPEACEALSKLTRLQVAAAADWDQAVLPALTACGRLTEICGHWRWSSSSAGAVPTLPQVVVLSPPSASGAVCARYECCPNLRCLREDIIVDGKQFPDMEYLLSAADLHALCTHCTGLRELVLDARFNSIAASYYHPSFDGLAAIQSLTSLQHLTRLTFTPETNLGHMAFLQACCVLSERHSLQELHVRESATCEVTLAAWMQLGQLRGLCKLSVQLRPSDLVEDLAEEAEVFLTSLSGCRAVHLSIPGPTDAFDEALASLREAGLPAPDVVVVNTVHDS